MFFNNSKNEMKVEAVNSIFIPFELKFEAFMLLVLVLFNENSGEKMNVIASPIKVDKIEVTKQKENAIIVIFLDLFAIRHIPVT